jgi:hypothetical protein
MKSIRRLRSKKNKTKNRKRRGGAAAVNEDPELKLFKKFLNIQKYVKKKYNYIILHDSFDKLKSLNHALLHDIPDEEVRTKELDTKMKFSSVSLLLFDLVPCYDMVNEIIINIKMHMESNLNLTEQLSLSKELCKNYPDFVDNFKSMNPTNIDNIGCLSLLKKHNLLDNFKVKQEIQNAIL